MNHSKDWKEEEREEMGWREQELLARECIHQNDKAEKIFSELVLVFVAIGVVLILAFVFIPIYLEVP